VARKPTDTVHLKLRFSEALRRRIESEAARNGHSMNAEIIRCVEESYRQADHRADLRQQTDLAVQNATTAMVTKFEDWLAQVRKKSD